MICFEFYMRELWSLMENDLSLIDSADGGLWQHVFFGSKVVVFLLPFLLVQCLFYSVYVLFISMRDSVYCRLIFWDSVVEYTS